MNAKDCFDKLITGLLERDSAEVAISSRDLISYLLVRSSTAGISNSQIDKMQAAFAKFMEPKTPLEAALDRFKVRMLKREQLRESY